MMPSLRFAGVVLLSLACLTGGSGCSLMFAKGPPKRPAPQQAVKCTTTYNLSILDGLIAALNVAGVLYVIGNPNSENQSQYARTTGVALGVGYAGVYGISAGVGADRVGRCRALLDARARARKAQEEDHEEEDEQDVTEPAKADGEAAPAAQPKPEVVPTVAPPPATQDDP